MKSIRLLTIGLILVALLLLLAEPASAQEGDFGIRLRRDFGYGAGSNVRGTFTISLEGDESQVAAVEFLIDGKVMARVESAPFHLQFHTDDYGFGMHELSAQVFLQDGRIETTASSWLNFVTPEDERGSITMIFGGLIGAMALGLLIFWLVQRFIFKRKPGSSANNYGLLGAAICPKCGRPFSRHIWGLNMVTGKLDRCEHCGKWSMTRRATAQELRAVEAAEASVQPSSEQVISRGQVDKNALDDSRYMDKL